MILKRMMALMTLVGLAILLVAVPAPAASIMKVAVVDLQSALNATTEGLAAKETLRKKHMAKQEQVDAMKEELESMEQKIKSPVLSEAAQEDLRERYQRKKAQLIEFVALAKEEEDRENQQLSSRILEGLVKITREIAQAEGYTIVLEKSGSAVVYFEEDMDITERIVKIYNERHQEGQGQ